MLALVACSSRRTVIVTPKAPRQVEIEVEVYDPATNFVWEGVSLRVVEGYHEWSGCTCAAGNPDLWQLTDPAGLVLFTSVDLADADIGFLEDEHARAIIEPDARADEAFVLIELDALGFDRLLVDVPLSWDEPAVFVSIPFSEPVPGPGPSASQSGLRPRLGTSLARKALLPSRL